MTDRGRGNHPEYIRPQTGDADTHALVSLAVTDAIRYVEEELGPERVKATEYYHGEKLGNEVEGRSQAIMTEVRDGITGQLPGLLRIIHGPEHVVEYVPKRADQVAQAAQATDYARFIFEEDNQGFLTTHSVLKDGLLKKIGIVKWGMDDTEEVVTQVYRGLTREDLALLAADEKNDLRLIGQVGDGMWDVEVSRTTPVGRVWVKAIPPDDFFWNREARSLDEAILVGHRERLTKSDLLAMGVREADIEDLGGAEGNETLEEEARREVSGSVAGQDPEMGEANRRYTYCEVYMRLPVAGKDVTELRRVCTLGDQHAVVKNEPVASRPFAIYCPDPEPHAMLGGSWYDRLKDMQRINSQLLRGFLDSLSVSLFPRPVYVDGQASVADIMNNAIGAPVRERLPNMVRWDNIPFTGDKVLPAMNVMREVVERRIGTKDGAMSLDMDALQSTGKEAVNAAITAAQSVGELLARLYAEQVLKPMFRGILRLVAHPASQERLIRLRGQYVPVQPGTWDANMDVSVNVALGSMNVEKKIAVLREVVSDQSMILEAMGPTNPIVSLPMLRNAKAKILDLSGVKDVANYYKELPDDWQPPPPPEPQPSEDELWRQAEAKMSFEKNMKELAIKQDELALKKLMHDDEQAARAAELAIKQNAVNVGPHNAEIERYKADLDAQNEREEILSRERIEAAKLDFEREKLAVQMDMERYKADTTAATAHTTAALSAETTKETAKLSASSKEKASSERAMASTVAKTKPQNVVVEQPDLSKLAQAISDLKNTPPVVHVPAPVVHIEAPPQPKKGKRKGKLTGPDGKVYTIETED